MLIVHTSTPLSLPTSWLKRRVSVSQVGVSREGTDDRMRTLPRPSASVTGFSPLSPAVKSGAACPGLLSGPPCATGLPSGITTRLRSSGMRVLLGDQIGRSSVAERTASPGSPPAALVAEYGHESAPEGVGGVRRRREVRRRPRPAAGAG